MNLAEAKGYVQLREQADVLLPAIKVADSFGIRALGMMGKVSVPETWGAGLFFPNCRSLHGCFMRFDLEVWFLDGEGQPIGRGRTLKPWGMLVGPKGTRHCMEIIPGIVELNENPRWQWTDDATPLA
jgi:uncharacterized membrane protein (UPF0127 family)